MSTEEPSGGSGQDKRDPWVASHLTTQKTDTAPGPLLGPGAAMPPARPTMEPYHLGLVLGEGGMAIIYEALDPALERSVAVKVLKPALARDAELQSRFLHEARILGQLEHPGIVPVFAAGTLPGYGPFYAMKKVRGRTLREILRGMGSRDFRDRRHTGRLVGIFEKVCQTVAYAHAAGILHRDLKPENIMVDEFGVVVVLDWGLSKKLNVSAEEQGIVATQIGIVKGTPAYMSPEQASGSGADVDFRTDVFALGIILYEVLTGSLPFSGHSRTEVMEKVLYHDPAPPRHLNRQASRTLAAVCMKALSKDPEKRYPTAGELAEDIRLYRDHLPTSAYRAGPIERLGNWIGRHHALAAAAGTALLLLLAFGGFAIHRAEARRIRRAEQAERERLVEELAEQRLKEKTQKTLLAIRTGSSGLRGLDEKILSLEAAMAKLERDDPAYPALRNQMDELEAARYVASNNLRSIAIGLISELSAKAGGDIRQLDPDILKFFREVAVELIQSLVKRRDYYKAHYHLWDFLRPDRESPIPWTEAQLKELMALRRQVEAQLRESRGPGAPLPDWAKYSDRLPRRKRD
ncbi:MAG TPA: serine/threonine-protein kinase [Planctomycetota bacterium]|nr:serine/threonine-protein kinase [Planctomycetota bacterium]